jgi:glycogen operon protein
VAIGIGHPFPLGATVEPGGVNFSVFSANGTRVFVCLFDGGDPNREVARLELPGHTTHVFHGFVPDVGPGALYGLRVEGPYAPEQGHRFNVNKLLLDPYARALHGTMDLKGPICGYDLTSPDKDLSFDERDSAAAVPRCVVVAGDFDWGNARSPERPLADSVIYEVHVRGFTKRHPGIPEELRGTYLGLGHPAALEHLRALGVTAVELLPVQAFDNDGALADRGLTNYWGYNPLGYFAPHAAYAVSRAPGAAVHEFKLMVRALHDAGIEVLMDVVYNHTWEGNQEGPTVSFRGLDNAAYYLASEQNARYPMQFSGCGNCFNMRSPYAMRLVMESLRYWATEMHVDGFRVDLAPVLGRETWRPKPGGEGSVIDFDADAGFFRAVHQDPVLSRKKLIAEPWDIGEGGYQLGNFPILWSEWNGRFRDDLRRFWRGDENVIGQVAYRLTGSADVFEPSGRRASASINMITCHDGFTLHDVVTYGHKHNERNGETNGDGAHDNHTWNHGEEGESEDPGIRQLRERQKRNFLTMLLLARGVPMLTAGDEIGRTQLGNNNAYCLDDETTWLDWDLDDARRALLGFTRRLVALRHELPTTRADAYFDREGREPTQHELRWLMPGGAEMVAEDWNQPNLRALQLLWAQPGQRSVLWLVNADPAPRVFTLPQGTGPWRARVDTRGAEPPEGAPVAGGATYELSGRSLAVLVGD